MPLTMPYNFGDVVLSTQVSLLHISSVFSQTAARNLAASVLIAERVRLTRKEILLCFFGSGIFILVGTLVFNFLQNKQRPRK